MSFCKSFYDAISDYEKERCAYPLIDTHVHCVDFLQQTDGLKALIERMDEANILRSVVFGLPVIKKWESEEPDPPYYYLDDNGKCYFYTSTDAILKAEYEALEKPLQNRLLPMICGFNATDRNSVFHVEKKLDMDGFWRGIGEVMCRHDDLTNLTQGETCRINHSALLPIYDLAGSRDLPVMVHQNSSSVGHHDRFEYLYEVKNVLSAFPGTTFIWAHCGISRRVGHKSYHLMIKDVLSKYSNVYVDLSWVVYDQTVCRKDATPRKCWLKLMDEYPDRFLVGSDLCGHFDLLGKTMARYNLLFEMLENYTRKMICTENAKRIWKF